MNKDLKISKLIIKSLMVYIFIIILNNKLVQKSIFILTSFLIFKALKSKIKQYIFLFIDNKKIINNYYKEEKLLKLSKKY